MTGWARVDLLVLDDLGLRPLTTPQAADLLEVIDGLTLPLLLVDGDAVGTVGITGSPTRIQRFGPGSCTSSS